MMILKKIWNFIKKCWYIPVGLLASLITFLVVRKNDLNDDTIFKISEDSKEKQINAIIRAEVEKKRVTLLSKKNMK